MDQDERTLAMNERPAAQPAQQILAIRRFQDGAQRIARPLHPGPHRHGKKMKVMVAQHGRHPVTETDCPPQDVQGTRTPVHEIADQPDSIRARIEAKTLEEARQRQKATLNVTDCVRSHGVGSIVAVFPWGKA
jgi:hypothetical protein